MSGWYLASVGVGMVACALVTSIFVASPRTLAFVCSAFLVAGVIVATIRSISMANRIAEN